MERPLLGGDPSIGETMRIAYLQSAEIDILGERVLNLINNRHIVCIRDFPDDKHKMAELLWKIGHPVWVNDPEFHPNIEVMQNIDDGKWYNESHAWPSHVDGMMSHVDGTHEHFPITVMLAHRLDQVHGGVTYFHDMVEVFETLSEAEKHLFRSQHAAYQHPTNVGSRLIRDVPLVRRDRYWLREFPVWDEWFFRFLERDQGNRKTNLLNVALAEKSKLFRYDHSWREHDMLIWTNEGFTHGRTAITGGHREMWRAIVRDQERVKARFYPPEPEDA